MNRIFGAPTRYEQGPGAVGLLGVLTADIGERALIVVDADVLPFVAEALNTAFAARTFEVLPFRGEVTRTAIGTLAEAGRAFGADLLIGIGGGKGLDAAKGTALALDLPFVAVPSIASNDSPTARSLAVYNDDHVLVAIESLSQSPHLVVVDTALIAQAPARFLRSGMGDALAKKFEAEQAVADGAGNFFGGRASITALAIGDACYRTLRTHGVAAMRAAEAHTPDESFEAIVEANVLMAGLAWENGGLSYAHAVVRGLVKARDASMASHGEHVAYGVLVQLAIEDRNDDFIIDIMDFSDSVGLPISLKGLGMANATSDEISEIARLTAMGPQGGKIIVAASPQVISEAITRIERLSSARQLTE